MGSGDDDRELFERAMQSISPADVYRGKYGAPPSDEESEAPSEADKQTEQATREELRRLREERTMKDAFAGIEPIERGKYHRRTPAFDEEEDGVDDGADEFAAAMGAHDGPPAEEPEPERMSLAEEAGDCPDINLRGMSPDKALPKLDLFVDLSSKDGERFVQLKVGSNPPLLQAVHDWLRGDGSVYTLEFDTVDPHADAVVFARIRRQQRS